MSCNIDCHLEKHQGQSRVGCVKLVLDYICIFIKREQGGLMSMICLISSHVGKPFSKSMESKGR